MFYVNLSHTWDSSDFKNGLKGVRTRTFTFLVEFLPRKDGILLENTRFGVLAPWV